MTIFELQIGGFTLAPTYYWLMYVLGFIAWYWYFYKKNILTSLQLESLFFYIFFGIVLWGRIGYVLFYNLSHFISHPLDIIKVWEWGMSFHGWLLWVIFATYLFKKIHKLSFWKIMDQLAVITPVGIFFGRIWNYLNKELLWLPGYQGPFAIIKDGETYFPSPLLEWIFEWFVLFILLIFIDKHKKHLGMTSGYFAIFYGVFRLMIEIFIRSPDEHIWYIIWPLSLWALLCIGMIIVWLIVLITTKKYETKSLK